MTTTETRIDPPYVADESTQLNAFLDYHRATVVTKAAGLSEEDAHRSLLPSELMTVAGLLSHLRWVEAYWFDVVLDGQPDRAPYSKEHPDGEFEVAADLSLAQVIDDYRAQCASSRATVAKLALDDIVDFRGDRQVNVRWVILHMIEETARHVGHLDLIREQLDGATGE
ncbi:DinB family protein [Actinokineospora xionganensis]|uniref:DinB family protein n=1 Tax=Actinokineospora xionganensis TaxID=2684470 RepID=A0ABR7L4U0_9PSEU|nr:DinB family protein [Actinokineospora xionganensis]MBC6447700.1 DinB family protein [Actinokineospora xionganensis]